MTTGDLEFYHGKLVMHMAYVLSGHDSEKWETLSYRTKQKWLNKSVSTIQDMLSANLIKL